MDWFFLSPFSITVLNVCYLLGLLVYFLSRDPARSRATNALLVFLGGVGLVFVSFFFIFSSVDPAVTTRAWWAVHLFVFPAVAMVQFAYLFPEDPYPGEARVAYWACLLPALAVYPFNVWRTARAAPTFSFEGFLYVFLDTPEVGVLIGLELAWMLGVFSRKARDLDAGAPPGDAATSTRPAGPQARLIRTLIAIFFSPLALIIAIICAYLGYLSWGMMGHILGSGVMVAAFLFATLYLNHCAEPTTFMVKLVGGALGAILIAFGLAASVAVSVTEEAYDRERGVVVADAAARVARGEVPGGVAYVLRWPSGGGAPAVLAAPGADPAGLATRRAPPAPGSRGRGYRRLAPGDPARYFVTYLRPASGGVLEVGFPYLGYRRRLHETCLRLLAIQLATVVLVLAVLPVYLRRTLLRPLHALLEGVGRVDAGDLEARVPVRVRDEIGSLAGSFNGMVASIQEGERKLQASLEYQVRMTDAYSCFFPRQFLEFLEKDDVTQIRLGDSVQAEMAVLFSDIRSFTNLSEKMTPEETFAFVNEYLGRVGPVVRDQGGFIDKFIGDAVMALFPGAVDDALRAAIGMQRAVDRYNTAAGDAPPILTGIGIHTGPLMLGTIGEARRMEGTVISDAVNLAARIEGLTKRYGAAVIVSGETRDRLEDPAEFRLRLLDEVAVKGKAEAVAIYEVLDGLPPAAAAARWAERDAFDRARARYVAGDFAAARAAFATLAEAAVPDRAAGLYVARCERYLAEPPPAGWAGVTAMTSK